eukprot:scaffold21796_cov124-Isochrysis_galbana.AAC.3
MKIRWDHLPDRIRSHGSPDRWIAHFHWACGMRACVRPPRERWRASVQACTRTTRLLRAPPQP